MEDYDTDNSGAGLTGRSVGRPRKVGRVQDARSIIPIIARAGEKPVDAEKAIRAVDDGPLLGNYIRISYHSLLLHSTTSNILLDCVPCGCMKARRVNLVTPAS